MVAKLKHDVLRLFGQEITKIHRISIDNFQDLYVPNVLQHNHVSLNFFQSVYDFSKIEYLNTAANKLVYTVAVSQIQPFLIISATSMKHNRITSIKHFLINKFLIEKLPQVWVRYATHYYKQQQKRSLMVHFKHNFIGLFVWCLSWYTLPDGRKEKNYKSPAINPWDIKNDWMWVISTTFHYMNKIMILPKPLIY